MNTHDMRQILDLARVGAAQVAANQQNPPATLVNIYAALQAGEIHHMAMAAMDAEHAKSLPSNSG